MCVCVLVSRLTKDVNIVFYLSGVDMCVCVLADSISISILYASGLVWTCVFVSRLTTDINIVCLWSGVGMCVC